MNSVKAYVTTSLKTIVYNSMSGTNAAAYINDASLWDISNRNRFTCLL